MLKNLSRMLYIALLAAWAFDQIFWEKPLGISFPLAAVVLIAAGLLLAGVEERPPHPASLGLLVPILFLSGMAAVRHEPLSTFLNLILSVLFLALLTDSFRSGAWLRFGFLDYFFMPIRFGLRLLAEAPLHFGEMRRPADPSAPLKGGMGVRRLVPFLRGLLLALPVLVFLGTLLTSADLVFSARVDAIQDLFDIERLKEYFWRSILIAVMAYVILGGLRVALLGWPAEKNAPEVDETAPAESGSTRFLGFTESAIVLGGVNLLFASFVAIQFTYFFGGRANITVEGFTYAEYARRGFGELVLVAVCSLGLFFVLSAITRRETANRRWSFSALGILLSVLIAVILASAFQRLLIYEDAYGFTRMRTYPHVFMVWLGLLLAALVVLEIAGRTRYFAAAVLLAGLGFAGTLDLINVDGLIAHRNVARALTAGTIDVQNNLGVFRESVLDASYLLSLSTDAVPALFAAFDDPRTPAWLREEVGFVLTCQAQRVAAESEGLSWPSYHLSRVRAAALFAAHPEALAGYPAASDNMGGWNVTVQGEERSCWPYGWD